MASMHIISSQDVHDMTKPRKHLARSSRASYPSFLSLQETVQLQLSWAWRGLQDAMRWNVVFMIAAGDSEIRANIYKSLLMNLLSLFFIYTFDFLLIPLIQNKEKWFPRHVGWFYQALWLLPVVGVSFYLNIACSGFIAKRTYVLQHGSRASVVQTITYSGMLKTLATTAYRSVMVFTSLVLSFALGSIPYIGPVACFIFLCWMNSYYCFEYIWIARGLSLPRRIRHLEERWAYYLAFGLPSSALCTTGRGLANVALFALIFPSFIIMAMHAGPGPIDPYNPVSLMSDGDEGTIRHPSPFIPIRLPIFAIVLWLNNWIVWILSVGSGSKPHVGRGRALSDSTETAEKGVAADLVPLQTRLPPTKLGQGRIHLGRRKLD